MEDRFYFQNLARFEAALNGKPALASLLTRSFDEAFENVPWSGVQKRYAITTLGHAYYHFGFSVFGPLARRIIAEALAKASGLSSQTMGCWLEILCYQILEDFNVLKIALGEPNWTQVDASFLKDFSKRIICAESTEIQDVGLGCFSPEWIHQLQEVTTSALSFARPDSLELLPVWLEEALRKISSGRDLYSGFLFALTQVALDPLRLLVWRLECFATFSELRDEARFFMRRDSESVEEAAGKYAALLCLMLPHRNDKGELLIAETPVTATQLTKVLRSNFVSPSFDCAVVRNWIGAADKDLPKVINHLLQSATAAKLLFEVPLRRNQKGYGLTRNALRILEPFHATLTASLVKNISASNVEPLALEAASDRVA